MSWKRIDPQERMQVNLVTRVRESTDTLIEALAEKRGESKSAVIRGLIELGLAQCAGRPGQN